MHLEIPHKFTKDEALARAKMGIEHVRAQMQQKMQINTEEWQGDVLHFDVAGDGQRITGTFAVEEQQYVVDAKLPLMMRLFEGRIEKMLGEQIAQIAK